MANDYATVAELKSFIGIRDTERDSLLTIALGAGSRAIDQACGRRFYLDATTSTRTVSTHGRTLRSAGRYVLLVPDIAESAGLVVSGYTVTTDLGADDQPVITRLYSDAVWPETTVAITARWGWPTVPDQIKQAALLMAARLFKRKDSPEGLTGSAEWGAVRVSRADPDVLALIDPYMLPGVA